jgi:small subunit ribosomal protein S13
MRYFLLKKYSKKQLSISLMKFKGVGNTTAKNLLQKGGFSVRTNYKDIRKKKKNIIKRLLNESHTQYTHNKNEANNNIKKLIDISSYRGFRHVSSLPVNGQRTHTNRKTQRSLSKKRLAYVLK